jgi:hypothetical protein
MSQEIQNPKTNRTPRRAPGGGKKHGRRRAPGGGTKHGGRRAPRGDWSLIIYEQGCRHKQQQDQ